MGKKISDDLHFRGDVCPVCGTSNNSKVNNSFGSCVIGKRKYPKAIGLIKRLHTCINCDHKFHTLEVLSDDLEEILGLLNCLLEFNSTTSEKLAESKLKQ